MNKTLAASLGAATLVLALIIAPFGAIFQHAGFNLTTLADNQRYITRLWQFTLYQSVLSALCCTLLALPVARALSRQRFWGKQWLLRASQLSFCLPVILVAFVIIQSFGKQSPLNQLLSAWGYPLPPLYGLQGILLAHVYLNWPLAVLMFYRQLAQVPASHWRLSQQLSFNSLACFRWVEWPALKRSFAATFALITGLCFTSFAIVLSLGGGPRSTTLELAIYQAISLEFDLNLAACLALIQLASCALILLVGQWLSGGPLREQGEIGEIERRDGQTLSARCFDALCLSVFALFLLYPASQLIGGVIGQPLPTFSETLQRALLTSWVVALLAGGFALGLALLLLLGLREYSLRRQQPGLAQLFELPAYAILLLPSLVLATGFFLLLRPWLHLSWVPLLMLVLINGLSVLPFALRLLRTPFFQAAERFDRRAAVLRVNGLARWRYIEWPCLRADLGHALAVSCTLAIGDMGAIALLGSQNITTLPLVLYRALGSYRFSEAAWLALLLALQCLLCYSVIKRFIGSDPHASRD